jgi:hypothetical protein
MQVLIHPKSLPVTPGWSQIGPRTPRLRSLPQRELSKAFQKTLSIQENRRLRKLRNKLAQGTITNDELIIGVLDAALSVRPPRVFTRENVRVIEKKPGVTRAA